MRYAGYAHVSLIYVYEKSLYHINTKKQGWQHQIYRYHLSFASCCDLQYHNSGLAVNVEKTKMVAMQTIQPHHYPMLTCIGEHIQFIQSFKYLGIDVAPTNKWTTCFDRH